MGDLTSLFQNLGVCQGAPNPTTSGTQQQSPQFDQMLNNLTQVLGSFVPNSVPTPTTCEKQEEQQPNIHRGVSCDGCGKSEFSGIRYKCSVCPDYDLCEICEAKKVHGTNHPMTKISTPVNYSSKACPYFRPGHSSRPVKPPSCGQNNRDQSRFLARFVEDVTVPDGTISPANLNFVKIWRLRNEGSLAWPEGTRLLFVGGDKLSNLDFVPVPMVKPGEEVDIAVDMKSPISQGRYVSYWRLSQPDGSRFGQRVWVDILVAAPESGKANSVEVQAAPVFTPVETQTCQSSTPVETQTSPASIPVETQTAPVPIPVVPQTASAEVQQLLDMGFQDKDHIEALLKKNQGDMLRTVQDLLNRK